MFSMGGMTTLAAPALWLQQEPSSPLQNPLIPILMMVAVFYLVLFLPMRRRQKKMEQMLRNLEAGDRVVTSGGLVGTIVALSDQTVTLRTKPDSVKLEFARSAVTGIANEGEEEKTK